MKFVKNLVTRFSRSHYSVKVAVTGMMALALFAGVRLVTTRVFRTQAAGSASLVLSGPATAQIGSQVTTMLTLASTNNNPVDGVDIVLKFDPTLLRLDQITPLSGINNISSLRTFLPLTSSNQFNSTTVISQANQTGTVRFSAVSFDIGTQALLPAYTSNSSLSLAQLAFTPLKSGSATISFDYTSAQPDKTTDTNVVGSAYRELLGTVTNYSFTIATAANPTSSPGGVTTQSTVNRRIPNSGFQTGLLSPWTANGADLVASPMRNTPGSARLNDNNAYVSQDISKLLQPGISYTFTSFVQVSKAGSIWGVPSMRLSKFADLGTDDYGRANAENKVSSSWQELKVTRSFTAQDLSKPVYLGVKNFGFNGTAFVDDFDYQAPVVPTSTPVPTATPSPTPRPTATPTPAPTAVPVVSLPNSDFESNSLSGWSDFASAVVVSGGNTGSYSVTLTGTDARLSQPLNTLLTPGRTYTFEAFIKVNQAGASSWGRPYLRLSRYSDLGSGDYGQAAAENSTSANWQKITLTRSFTAAELASPVHFGVRNFGFDGISQVDSFTIK